MASMKPVSERYCATYMRAAPSHSFSSPPCSMMQASSMACASCSHSLPLNFRMILPIDAAMGKIIRKFNGKEWEQLAQAMLDACIIEQGGEENEWEGAARMYVAQYLSETGFIDAIEGQPVSERY